MRKYLLAALSIVAAQAALAYPERPVIASEQKIGSIPRILSPQETERFMGEQYETYARLGAQLHLELK
jgi:hypothetical protein